jgi:hypothetical protein
MSLPCPAHPYTSSSVFFLDQENRPFQGHSKFLFFSPIGSLGGRVKAKRFHSVPWVSQWEILFVYIVNNVTYVYMYRGWLDRVSFK